MGPGQRHWIPFCNGMTAEKKREKDWEERATINQEA